MAYEFDNWPQFRDLLVAGKKKGFLTYDEISEALYKAEDLAPDKFDELLDQIQAAGIEIRDPEDFLRSIDFSDD